MLDAMRTPEHRRLEEAREGRKWRRWGTYLSERQWGTVREDYSADGDAWRYLPFDHAHLRAYRWGEDGLLGLSDNRGLVCFAPALWNGADPLLKERLFGLSGPEGNHGEDVKELYFYLESTPTGSWARALYKYPQRAFPYEELRVMARREGRGGRTPTLLDTGALDGDRYFDVFVEYAKADVEDVLVRITAHNRGPDPAPLEILPQLWFRNTWSWEKGAERPRLSAFEGRSGARVLLEQAHLGTRVIACDHADAELLFTENDSNALVLWGVTNASPYVKDAFHRLVVRGERAAVSPERRGTKCAWRVRTRIPPGGHVTLRLRMAPALHDEPFHDADAIFRARKDEHDAFWNAVMPASLGEDDRRLYVQAMAGLLWSRQYYHYDVHRWLKGDPAQPAPPAARRNGRNSEWSHLYNSEVLSMPDKWEYPWYAAWDLAFHCIPLALCDAELAKQQLSLLLREWYMHPSGQLPAYEWALSDVNPPVHAWAALRVYQIERRMTGRVDRAFLESVFHKLMLNFTWWVNRKDAAGRNVFQGGFLGLDNIGVFDRSKALPGGGHLEQADATSWMGLYCLNMLDIALELARENKSYQDVANKFFEHFLYIAHAINLSAGGEGGLWDERDGFFYDCLNMPGRGPLPLKVRSMVGLIPLFAVGTLEPQVYERFPEFVKRVRWFVDNRPELTDRIASIHDKGAGERRLLSILNRERLVAVLGRVLDEREFLSPYGVRGLSRVHAERPFRVAIDGATFEVGYEPGESRTYLFGGNSNWRGPVWWPVNYLLIESLQRFHHFYGDSLRVECPVGSGTFLNLWEVACELSRRLVATLRRDAHGHRPAMGGDPRWRDDPHFRDLVLFHEYFHGDTGQGLGASHQTGWTALVAKLLQQSPLWGEPAHHVRGRVSL
jgi:hypothetical protein